MNGKFEEVILSEDWLKKINELPESDYIVWTPVEIAILTTAYQKNKDIREIAKLLNRTFSAVQKKIERMGLGREE